MRLREIGLPKPRQAPIAALFPRGHKDATTSGSKLRRAFRKYPNANIGLVPRGDIFVIDVDGPKGEQAIESLGLPETAWVTTGGGHHLYHTYTGPLPPKLEQVDIRQGAKGYVVAPPSKHASGEVYRWSKRPDVFAELPSDAFATIQTKRSRVNATAEVSKGGRNNELTRLAGALRRFGLEPEPLETALLAVNENICHPPLEEREVGRIAQSVSRYPTPIQDAFGSMADVEEEEVDWLYSPYIPRGTLTILEGEPGVGKSNFSLAVASAVSTGKALPWSPDRTAGRVLILSAEDDPSRVLKPRLELNGANHNAIRYQKELFSLDDSGIATVRHEMEAFKPDLVIIDPIIAFLGPGDDLNDAADMTRFLTQLDWLARDLNCALLIVRHLRKSSEGSPINRGLGSIALAARVRSMLLLGRHPDNQRMRAVAHVKSNYAEEGPTIIFSLVTAAQGRHPQVRWEDTDPNITVHDILATTAGPGRPLKEIHTAMTFLEEFLRDGGKDSQAVSTAAEERGITSSTLRRASKELKILKRKRGHQSVWSLPETVDHH